MPSLFEDPTVLIGHFVGVTPDAPATPDELRWLAHRLAEDVLIAGVPVQLLALQTLRDPHPMHPQSEELLERQSRTAVNLVVIPHEFRDRPEWTDILDVLVTVSLGFGSDGQQTADPQDVQ